MKRNSEKKGFVSLLSLRSETEFLYAKRKNKKRKIPKNTENKFKFFFKAELQRKIITNVLLLVSSPFCLVFLLVFFSSLELVTVRWRGWVKGGGLVTLHPFYVPVLVFIPLFCPQPTITHTTLTQHSHNTQTTLTQHSHTSHTSLTHHSHNTHTLLTHHSPLT